MEETGLLIKGEREGEWPTSKGEGREETGDGTGEEVK